MSAFSPEEIKAMEDEIRRLTKGALPKDVEGPTRPELYPLLIETLRAERKGLVSHDAYKASLAKKQLSVAASERSSLA